MVDEHSYHLLQNKQIIFCLHANYFNKCENKSLEDSIFTFISELLSEICTLLFLMTPPSPPMKVL